MLKKSFSPIRIQNPTSIHQLAKISVGQEIILLLDTEVFGECSVELSTDLLEISRMAKVGKVLEYVITHSESVNEWANYSSVMLGEIWIDGKNNIGKVGVLLESSNVEKSQIRTVVNPDCLDLRIYPHNVLEVIVYDQKFGFHDEWNYDFKSMKDVEMELMGYDQLCLHSWDHYNGLESPDYFYSRLPRGEISEGLLTRQHHFWFRLNHKAFKLIAQETSIVQVGNLIISGISNRYQLQYAEKKQYHLALYVDCRKKNYKQMQDTINLKLRNESSPSGAVSGYKNQVYTPSQLNSLAIVPQKEILPEIRDVDIKFIEIPGDEVTGCKTLSTINDSYKTSYYQHSDYYYEFDEEDTGLCCQYPNKNPRHSKFGWRHWE